VYLCVFCLCTLLYLPLLYFPALLFSALLSGLRVPICSDIVLVTCLMHCHLCIFCCFYESSMMFCMCVSFAQGCSHVCLGCASLLCCFLIYGLCGLMCLGVPLVMCLMLRYLCLWCVSTGLLRFSKFMRCQPVCAFMLAFASL